MASWRAWVSIVVAVTSLAVSAFADAPQGATAAFEVGVGTQGIYSYEEVGLRLPALRGGFSMAVKARLLSSLTWATFIDPRSGEAVSFHPDVVGGVLSFGGASPLASGAFRAHGALDILLGTSFTPWDSAIYGKANLIGDNLTFAFIGSFGIELFTAPRVSLCLDAGGGWKSLFADKANPYAIASSWLGSGFGIRMGMRFYR
jgi:hypothetical protein